MRARSFGLFAAVLLSGILIGFVSTRAAVAPGPAAEPTCGSATPQVRNSF